MEMIRSESGVPLANARRGKRGSKRQETRAESATREAVAPRVEGKPRNMVTTRNSQ